MGKRLGILTSGGDCPGLNAVIRAVVSHATFTYNWQVLGIPYATRGLLVQTARSLSTYIGNITPAITTISRKGYA